MQVLGGRLPRARGDRPCGKVPRLGGTSAAPRTRGSTYVAACIATIVEGCPAHAGIDLWSIRGRGRVMRLPRARGDRPTNIAVKTGQPKAAPRTRGSTLWLWHRSILHPGCPAHAGIDLNASVNAASSSRLPRARGDRPGYSVLKKHSIKAAPRTRGSTCICGFFAMALKGCPAHAGIDPREPRFPSCIFRLPRARGDRPLYSAQNEYYSRAAPRTRGSTGRAGF